MATKMLPRKRLSAPTSDDTDIDRDSIDHQQQQVAPGATATAGPNTAEGALPYAFLPVQVMRKRKKTSWVWHHFLRGAGEGERNVCRHCLSVDGGDATSYPRTTGNSTLAVHLLAKHGIAKGELGSPGSSSIPGTPVAPAPRVVNNNAAVAKALAVAASVMTSNGASAPVSHADHVFQTPSPTKAAAASLNAQQHFQQQQQSQVMDARRKAEIDDALLDLVVDAKLVGSDVLERASFCAFCEKLNPSYEPPPTRDALIALIDTQFHQALQKFFFVVQVIPGGVALTLDRWSVPGYVGLTLHWVSSDWVLKKCLLEFKHAPAPAFDAWCVSELIVTTLRHYNISTKVRAITTDNSDHELESSITNVRKTLQDEFAVQVSESWHLRCVSHILHQCVTAALEKIAVPLATLRTILKYAKDSDALRAMYKAVQQQAGKAVVKDELPVLDVENKWDNATGLFAMIDEAYAVKDVLGVVCSSEAAKVLRALLPQSQQRGLSDVDWRTLKCTRDFLAQAVAFTVVSEEHDFVSASLLPLIYDSLQAHCKKTVEGRASSALSVGVTVTPLAKSAASAFLDVLQQNKRHLWNDLANLAQILDPRVSNASVEAMATKSEIRRTLVEQYGLNVQESSGSSASELQAEVATAPTKPERQISSLFAAARQARNESHPERATEDEVDTFFKFTANADLGCDDVLEWWRVVGAQRFPKMSLLARDTLMITGSALPPRAFSGSDQLVMREKNAAVNEVKGLEIATKVRAWSRFA